MGGRIIGKRRREERYWRNMMIICALKSEELL